VNPPGAAPVSSAAITAGRVTPRTVSWPARPVLSGPAPSSRCASKVITGWRSVSSSRAERTVASRCGLPVRKLAASISA
jgi:hypothetical protein